MKGQLKVGMSFRVFEISNRNPYYKESLTGRWFCEQLGKFKNDQNGVDTPVFTDFHVKRLHLGIDYRNHAKLKAKLTITKLK